MGKSIMCCDLGRIWHMIHIITKHMMDIHCDFVCVLRNWCRNKMQGQIKKLLDVLDICEQNPSKESKGTSTQ